MAKDNTFQDKLEEYKVLTLKFTDNDELSSAHSVFLKKHRSDRKSFEKPLGKTLTVLNLPPFVTKESIARVFSIAGEVEKVQLIENYSKELNTKYQVPSLFFSDSHPFKFMIGFVVYKKSQSLDLIMCSDELPPLNTEVTPLITGIAKWTEEYNKRLVDSDEMQMEVDNYMKHYDGVKQAEEVKDEGDDDGWTIVGKRGHNAGFKQKESVISRLEQKIQNQKNKTTKLSNFYSFETRDSKKQQLMELRKKFEDDKLKMNSFKQNRRFKPYQ